MGYNLPFITTQQMMIFIEVVKRQGFAKAGEYLHMTQSAVSKSVARLENELGIVLFERTTRHLSLTNAGHILYESWQVQLEAIQKSYNLALGEINKEKRILRLGLLNTALPSRYFKEIMPGFSDNNQILNVKMESRYMTDLVGAIRGGEFDIVILPDFMRFCVEKLSLSWKYAAVGKAQLIVSKNHPLAKRRKLKMADLVGLTFVSVNGLEGDLEYRMDLCERLRAYGCEPNISHIYKTAYDIRYLFNPDDAVLMVDAFFDDSDSFENCKKIPITDQENGLICVWDSNNKNPEINKFIETLPIRKDAAYENG